MTSPRSRDLARGCARSVRSMLGRRARAPWSRTGNDLTSSTEPSSEAAFPTVAPRSVRRTPGEVHPPDRRTFAGLMGRLRQRSRDARNLARRVADSETYVLEQGDWEPTRWYTVLGPDGRLWRECSDRDEAVEAMRHGDRLLHTWQRIRYESVMSEETP